MRRGALDRMVAWSRASRDAARPLLWIHAPSVGEGLMAGPVIERVRRSIPKAQVVYTYFSPSAEAFAAKLPVDFAGALPFDTSGAAVAMIDAVRPTTIVFSKLDVWPLLVEVATRRGIPIGLISATLSEGSGRRSGLASLLLGDAYASLAAVGAVHQDDATRLAEVGVRSERIIITGDTRYDQVWARLRSPSPNADLVAKLKSARPTIVAGSTWPSDDIHVLLAFSVASLRDKRARLILASHEPNDAQREHLRMLAAQSHLSLANVGEATPDTDIVWVDRMGILADLYALATVAYVGGGFHDKGLHSVVEPAAHGVPVLFGPAHEESRDALALLAAGGAFAVSNGQEFSDRVANLFSDPVARTAAGEKARGVVTAGLGAADRSAALVEKLLAG
jgi:3-deoxy-D-manno-octulosonic-acid transferase